MGEYRRGESRSGTSQLGMLVEQEAGKHSKFYVRECTCGDGELVSACGHDGCVAGVEQLGCPNGRDVGACGNRWNVHHLRPLPAVHRGIGLGQPVELVWRERRSEDQADRL
jgi:hypothetical protein